MLKCSLLSKTTLTDLFLGKKPSLKSYRFFSCDVKNNFNIQINVKLVTRKSDGRILYAQGEQDFADLLLSFLAFPLGGVVRKLGGHCSVGNIDSLYKSIINLDETKYLVSKEAKNRLVDPHLALKFKLSKEILPIDEPCVRSYYCYYESENYEKSVTYNKFFITDECRSDEKSGTYKLLLLFAESPRGSDEGYVKGPRAYMATDDLVLTPWSPISALHLINHLEVPLNDLKEKHITIGAKEVGNIETINMLCFVV